MMDSCHPSHRDEVARRQSSPDTGKCSARPAGRPGDFFHVEGAFATIPSAPLSLGSGRINTEASQYALFKAWRNLSGPMGFQKQKTKSKPTPWDGTIPPPAGRPRTQVKERAGRITLFLIVRRWVPTGYSSIGLLASIARLRFTGTRRITRTPRKPRLMGTFLLCAEGDISTLR